MKHFGGADAVQYVGAGTGLPLVADLRRQRLAGDEVIGDGEHRQRPAPVAGGQRVELGRLHLDGEDAVALDNLSTGERWLAPPEAPFIEADVGDEAALAKIFADHDVREVIHFAGSILVSESIRHPLDYYSNNTMNTLKLLRACVTAGVKRFIFSSTASVYGTPERVPISEAAPIRSITPYGAGEIGKPTHLIKAAAQIALGLRNEKLQIYGGDYPTPDGSAIRDYVHVSDLAQAHLAALERLRSKNASITLNCGYGRGYSVYEVIESFRRVSGAAMEYDVAPRRAGDPAQLIADNAAIRTVLDWRPRYDDIDFIVETAIDWERRLAEKATAAPQGTT